MHLETLQWNPVTSTVQNSQVCFQVSSWQIIHPATSPAAATNLPPHAVPAVGGGELPRGCSRVRGSPRGSGETWAGSTPRRLEALPGRISDQYSSWEHIQVGQVNGSDQIDLKCEAMRKQYLGPEEKGMKAWGAWPSAFAGSKRRGLNSWKRINHTGQTWQGCGRREKENVFLFFISYMRVCPNSGVVVCTINTDQTDGTLGRKQLVWESFTL